MQGFQRVIERALAPFPLMIFRLNLKFDQNVQCSGLKCTPLITTKFCTHHDSVTVMTSAKLRCGKLPNGPSEIGEFVMCLYGGPSKFSLWPLEIHMVGALDPGQKCLPRLPLSFLKGAHAHLTQCCHSYDGSLILPWSNTTTDISGSFSSCPHIWSKL